jgi:Spy/CpxP family protein refolding chaperone
MTMRKAGSTALLLLLITALGLPIHAGQTTSTTTTTTATTTPSTPSLTGLQTALDLTAAQVSQLQTLIQSQQSSIQTLLTNLRTAQQALQTALKGTDTAAIGAANLAVQNAQTALTNAQKANQQALMAVLTTAQQQIINDFLLIAQNGGPGPFGLGIAGARGGAGGRGGPFPGGPRP